jgi:hypothetical protein
MNIIYSAIERPGREKQRLKFKVLQEKT